MKVIDTYGAVAKTIPSVLVVGPIATIAMALIGWEVMGTATVSLGVACAILGVSIPQIRDRGKKEEERRWEKRGGSPSLIGIRHRGRTAPKAKKKRIHDMLKTAGVEIPTAELEETDPKEADDMWREAIGTLCTAGLKDPRVESKNRTYGFLRNSYAAKPIGLTLNVGGALICAGTGVLSEWNTDVQTGMAVNGALFAIWTMIVTESAVDKADKAYAEALFEVRLQGSEQETK